MFIRVKLLGVPKIYHEGNWLEPLIGLPSALLYYLAYTNSWVKREELAFLFWADLPESTARRNLRNLVLRVKDLPYTGTLEIERDRLRWQIATDVQAFRQAQAAEQNSKATELYEGSLLEGFYLDSAPEFADWLEFERERLKQEHQFLVLRQLERLEAKENYAEAAKTLESLRKAMPFDETLLRQQLHYLKLSQQPSQAIALFETFQAFLQKEMDVLPEEETLQLIKTIRQESETLAGDLPKVSSKPKVLPRTFAEATLPTQLTPFIGREVEKTRIAEQLADPACRLLTLLAPGGFGKTRLAIAAAKRQQGVFRDGVVFVGLADANTAEQMLYAIADALDTSLLSATNLEANLQSFLVTKELLLVLDNLEQLSSDFSLISELLKAAPKLKLLVTSRERLSLSAEWLMDVRGLSYPIDSSPKNPESFDALSLFVQTAKRLKADFVLDDSNVNEVITICQLVEGMPLALELAASWLQVLSVSEIVAEVKEGLDLLESSSRDAPERHQSIRAVFDSSWAFLTEKEQAVLRSLAIFEAGFSREAAQLVSQANLIVLGRLIDKSFLTRSATGRYFRHPLIYQYTKEKLAASVVFEAVREKHARYFLERLQVWSQTFYKGAQTEVLVLFEMDLANIRAAWHWALDSKQFDNLRGSCDVIEKYFVQSNRFKEGLEFFTETEQHLGETEPLLLAEVLVSQAGFQDRFGNNTEVARCSAQAHALASAAGDIYWMAQSLNVQGIAAIHQGNYLEARNFLEQAIVLTTDQETLRIKARASNNLALTHLELGNYEEASKLYQQALELNKALGNQLSSIKNLSNLGNLFYSMKRFEEAEHYFQKGLALVSELGFQEPLQHIYSGLAMVAIELGDLTKADDYAHEALKFARESGEKNIEVEALRSLAKLAALNNDDTKTNELLLRAISLAWEVEALPYLQDVLVDLAALRLKEGAKHLATDILTVALNHKASSQTTKEQAQQLLKTIGVAGQTGLKLEDIMQKVLLSA